MAKLDRMPRVGDEVELLGPSSARRAPRRATRGERAHLPGATGRRPAERRRSLARELAVALTSARRRAISRGEEPASVATLSVELDGLERLGGDGPDALVLVAQAGAQGRHRVAGDRPIRPSARAALMRTWRSGSRANAGESAGTASRAGGEWKPIRPNAASARTSAFSSRSVSTRTRIALRGGASIERNALAATLRTPASGSSSAPRMAGVTPGPPFGC